MRLFWRIILISLIGLTPVVGWAQASGSTTIDDVQQWSGSDATSSLNLGDSQTLTLDSSVSLDTGFDVDEAGRIFAPNASATWDVTFGATFTITASGTDSHIVDVFAAIRSNQGILDAGGESEAFLELEHRFASTESITGPTTVERYFEFTIPFVSGNVGDFLLVRIESAWGSDSVSDYYAINTGKVLLLGGTEGDWATPVPSTNTPTPVPTWTFTPTPTPTQTPTTVLTPPTFTNTPVPPTDVPPTSTNTPFVATFTPVGTFTPITPSPTNTPIPTFTPRTPTPVQDRLRLPPPELVCSEYIDQVIGLKIELAGLSYTHQHLSQLQVAVVDRDLNKTEQVTVKATGGFYTFPTLGDGRYRVFVIAEPLLSSIEDWTSSVRVSCDITLVNDPTPVPAPTHNPWVIDWQLLDPDPFFAHLQLDNMPDYPSTVPTPVLDQAVRRVEKDFKVWDSGSSTWKPFAGKSMVDKLEEEDGALVLKVVQAMTAGTNTASYEVEGWDDQNALLYGRSLEAWKVYRGDVSYRDYVKIDKAPAGGLREISFHLGGGDTWQAGDMVTWELTLDKIQGIATWTPTPYPQGELKNEKVIVADIFAWQ